MPVALHFLQRQYALAVRAGALFEPDVGEDVGFGPVARAVGGLRARRLDAAEASAIGLGNASYLLPCSVVESVDLDNSPGIRLGASIVEIFKAPCGHISQDVIRLIIISNRDVAACLFRILHRQRQQQLGVVLAAGEGEGGPFGV